jgi:predicted RNA methylase
MLDKKMLPPSFSRDRKPVDDRISEFTTPNSVIDLVGYLGANFEPESVLDPSCGTGGFIDSFLKYCKKPSVNIKGVEINGAVAKAAKEEFKAHRNVVIEIKDSLAEDAFKTGERYDVVMCDPPFGRTFFQKKVYPNTETAFLDKCLSLVKQEGYLIIVVPDGVLSRSDHVSREIRAKIIKHFNLIAVLSLPAFIYAHYTSSKSSIKSSILVIKNSEPSRKGIIFGDFKDTNFKKDYLWECISKSGKPNPPLFLIERNTITEEIELHRHLPVEYKIGTEVQTYPFVRLSEIADIIPIRKISELGFDSLILRKVGNFKIVSRDYLTKISEKTIKNYCLLRLRENLNIDFLRLIFESEIFQKQVELISRGAFIRSIRDKDLADILIPLPTLEDQIKIAQNYRNVEMIVADAVALREKILKDPISKDILLDKRVTKGMKNFSDQAIRSTLEDLPSPIAMVLRQTRNIGSGREDLTNSVALFDTLLKFMGSLIIMESYQKHLFEHVGKIAGVSFLTPSIGKWFAAFRNVTQEIVRLDRDGELINSLLCAGILSRAKEMVKQIEDTRVISIRNDYLAHGAIGIPDETYRVKNDELRSLNDALVNEMAESLYGYKLIYMIDYKKKGSLRYGRMKRLNGENRDFITEEDVIPAELDTEKVLLVSGDYLNWVSMDPLLHLGVCSECGTENLFFFDKRDKNHVQYFSYLHSHKTKFDLLTDVQQILELR